MANDLRQEKNAVMTGLVQLTDEETNMVTGGGPTTSGVTLISPICQPVGGPCNARTANNGYEHSDGRGAYFVCGQAGG